MVMRYVTLQAYDDAGEHPVVEEWPTADRDEWAAAVNEDYPEIGPVLIDEVVLVTKVTEHLDGTKTTETYQTATGNKIADPSGATEATGRTLTRVVDPGGALCVYSGDELLKEYDAGVWRSCSEDPPAWLADPAGA